MEIRDRRVFITGANRGIGLALASAFAERGAHLILGSRAAIERDVLKTFENQGAASVRSFEIDLSSFASTQLAIEKLREENLEIVVNNAGLLTGGLVEDQNPEDIYAMLQVNLTALMHLTGGLLPGMIARGVGKIVNNSSVSGIINFPCASTYSAAKSGVIAFTQSLQQELKGTGVSALVLITPGVKTRMYDAIPEKYGKYLDLEKMGTPIASEEWAELIIDAIEGDETVLYPGGTSGWAVQLARYFPVIINSLIETSFSRRTKDS